MQRFPKGVIGADQGTELMFSDFVDDGEMWTGAGSRERVSAISFSRPFRNPPLVHVSLEMWDTDRSTNQRVDISARNITEEGCDIVFHTWGDTRVARVRAAWFAIGELRDEDIWEID